MPFLNCEFTTVQLFESYPKTIWQLARGHKCCLPLWVPAL